MTLKYVTSGNPDNPSVVFLHGGSFTGRMWLEITGLLPEFHSIIPDLPGHGTSRDRALISLEQAADDVANLIEQRFANGPVHLVGLSLGGYIGMHLLIRHPELVRRAMISGIHAGAMPNQKLMILATVLSSPLMTFAWFRKQMVKMMGIDDSSLASDEEGQANATPKTMRAVGRLAVEFDIRQDLSSIDIPALVVAGSEEHPIVLESLGLFQSDMQNCIARKAPKMGHGWCVEDPGLFADTVRAWLNQQKLPDILEPV